MRLIDQVLQTVADSLNVPVESLDETSSSETVPAWDSLAQVNLIMALEQTFDVQVDVDDFLILNSVRAIAEYLTRASR
jgi:acyl carrier protein